MRISFIVYADFESFTPQLSTCQPNPEKSCTKQYQKHIPSGFCYHIKYFDDTLYSQQPVTFVKEFNDDDVAPIFMGTLEKTSKKFIKRLSSQNMIMTIHDKLFMIIPLFVTSATKNEDKVHDHCHLSGKFRGAAHEVCNLKYKVRKFFSVVFHNFSRYDSHLFIKTLGNSERDISCIPNNEENYICFTKQIIVDKFVNEEGEEVNVKRELRFSTD